MEPLHLPPSINQCDDDEEESVLIVPLFSESLVYSFPPCPSIHLTKRSLTSQSSESSHLFADNLWPGAKILSDLLVHRPELVRGKYICELGAGIPLPSLVALSMGAEHCCISDYPDTAILENIQECCNLNNISEDRMNIIGFAWGSDASLLRQYGRPDCHRFDVVLLSEVLWRDTYHLHAALADSCISILAENGTILLSLVHRATISAGGGSHSAEQDMEFNHVHLEQRHGLQCTLLHSQSSSEVAMHAEEEVVVYVYAISRKMC